MIVACLDGRVGEGTGDSSKLWAQCFYLDYMLTTIAWLHWPDCMYLKPSLSLFAIFSQFGAQEMTCTLQGRTKQISTSEHTCGLLKDLQRIVVWCSLDCLCSAKLIDLVKMASQEGNEGREGVNCCGWVNKDRRNPSAGGPSAWPQWLPS